MIEERFFGITKLGETVKEYILSNADIELSVINYGGCIKNIKVKDKCDNVTDVVLGYDTPLGYEMGNSFFGAFVGRYANRIKNSEFFLNNKRYTLTPNENTNHLHGTFSKRVLNSRIENNKVIMSCVSAPDEEGYPGTLEIEVKYSLTKEGGVLIEYSATSDEDTVINLTNHSYFNLNGEGKGDVKNHIFEIFANRYTPVKADLIPTGEVLTVDSTPFDFRTPKVLNEALNDDHEQIRLCSGIDHNLIFEDESYKMKKVANVKSLETGISLTVFTNQIALQFYTGNGISKDTAPHGKNGVKYRDYSGFCLETQHYPSSPNFENFPTTVLKKGEVYKYSTEYRFGRCK